MKNCRKNTAASYLFKVKKNSGSLRYSNININSVEYTKSEGSLLLQVYTAPQYVRDSMVAS
jgi:hypothetical protein